MTGNQIEGKGFRGALRYNLEKVEKGDAEVLDHSFTELSEKCILKEILMVRSQRPNLQKYFYHTSINFHPGENLDNQMMKQIGLDYLYANGFNQHQYIMFRHYDADHPHLHILVNRIDYFGQVVSDSNDYARSERVLRDLEKKYNLTRVISSREAKERAMTKNELEMMKRTNAPSEKMAMQIIIKGVLESKSHITTNEFISNLKTKGVDVLFNQASTGYVSGISYTYNEMIITGAKLGNGFKWSAIKNTIDYEQERDRTTIYACPPELQRRREANTRSKSVFDRLRAGHGHDSGNRAVGIVQYRRIPDSATDSGSWFPRAPFQIAGFAQTDRAIGRAVEGIVGQGGEISKVIPLAALLDRSGGGDRVGAYHESAVDGDCLLKKRRRKKKKKGARL